MIATIRKVSHPHKARAFRYYVDISYPSHSRRRRHGPFATYAAAAADSAQSIAIHARVKAASAARRAAVAALLA